MAERAEVAEERFGEWVAVRRPAPYVAELLLDRVKAMNAISTRMALDLTAACAAAGKAEAVGDPAGGWIWLPPRAVWDPWALAALDRNRARAL